MKLSNNFKEIPYWLDPPPLTKSFSDNELPARTDVLIIGSGYTGTTAAIRLKRAGVDVTLIDMAKLGTAASARNGGMTLTGLSEAVTKIEKQVGIEKVKQLFTESFESVNTVERLVAEGNIDCAFHRYGHLETAFKPAHFENQKRIQARLHDQYNHEVQIISPGELKSEIDSPLYHGALLDPISAGVHPARYIAGLIKMADELGVSLCEEVTAETVDRRGSGFAVQTNRGAITADEVIVATNGYTGPLIPWLQRRVVSSDSMMISTEELPAELIRTLIPNGRMIYDTKIFLYYFRLSPDGKRLLFGGRPKSPRKTMRQNAAYMYQDMLTVYPQLKDVSIEHAWTGKVGMTMDGAPHIGKYNGIYYSLGYCGHGVAFATYLGEKLSELIQGKDSTTAFIDLPFKAIPFYWGNLWFRPILYAYYSLLDRLA